MNRWWRRRIGLITVMTVLLTPAQSYAFIGLLEKMSGPGKFFPAFQVSLDRTVCLVRGSDGRQRLVSSLSGLGRDTSVPTSEPDIDAAVACSRDRPGAVRAFLNVELVTAASSRNVLFADAENEAHEVSLRAVRPVIFYRLHPALDLGIGFGWTHFSGDDFGAFDRFSIPVRAHLVPFGFRASRESVWRAVYLAVQGDLYLQSMDATDFGAVGTWRENREFQPSYFLGVDVIALLAAGLR